MRVHRACSTCLTHVVAMSRFGKSDVGATISVYSSRYDEWSEGRVMAYDPIRKMHLVRGAMVVVEWHCCVHHRPRVCVLSQVVYATGDRKWHMLKKDKKFKVLVASPSAKSKKGSGAASMRV